MDKKEIQKKIDDLRKEIRGDYGSIGKKLHELFASIDEYLNYLEEGLSKDTNGDL